MLTLPTLMIRVLAPFAPLFSQRGFEHVRVFEAGCDPRSGKTDGELSALMKAMGLDQQQQFHRYHRVLSRAKCSSTQASHVLLGLLAETFVPDAPLVVGVDETLERRRGKKIAPKGIYRDPGRSSHGATS